MRRLVPGLALLTLAWPAPAQTTPPPTPADPPGLRPTQLAVSGETSLGAVRFRATLVRKAPDSLHILTAAHCIDPGDVGRVLRLARDGDSLEARVVAVVRNPAFGTAPRGAEIPGADNALVELALEPGDAPALLEHLEPARLAPAPVPGPDGQAVPVYTIDQFGRAHGVRAGNFSNPRWLEWGPAYRPIPGDSGSGVFAYRRRPGSAPEPVLIGVVTDRSPLGGGASLVSRRDSWLSRSLSQPAG